LIHKSDTYFGCQVDHIVSEKHGGPTESDNLAYACTCCNRAKGTDLGSLSAGRVLTPFFNPRVDRWSDHFVLRDARIEWLTDVGEVTARILEFNSPERVFERETLRQLGRYPSADALAIIFAK
jgi:HNH endonuclease